MKTYWTTNRKPEVLKNIEKAGITNKAAIKTILNFEKRVLTTTNLIDNGMSWFDVCHTNPYHDAGVLLNKLNGNSFGKKDAEFWGEWVAYCGANGTLPTSNLGDCLC